MDPLTLRGETGFAFPSQLNKAFAFATNAMHRSHARHATRRALSHMTDEALDDLGFTRWFADHGC